MLDSDKTRRSDHMNFIQIKFCNKNLTPLAFTFQLFPFLILVAPATMIKHNINIFTIVNILFKKADSRTPIINKTFKNQKLNKKFLYSNIFILRQQKILKTKKTTTCDNNGNGKSQ